MRRSWCVTFPRSSSSPSIAGLATVGPPWPGSPLAINSGVSSCHSGGALRYYWQTAGGALCYYRQSAGGALCYYRQTGGGCCFSYITVNYWKPSIVVQSTCTLIFYRAKSPEKLIFCSFIDGLPNLQSIVETSNLLPAFPVIRPWSLHSFAEESNSNTSVSPPEKFYVKDWDVPTFLPSK